MQSFKGENDIPTSFNTLSREFQNINSSQRVVQRYSDADLARMLQEEEIRLANESKHNDALNLSRLHRDHQEIPRAQSKFSSSFNLAQEDRSTFQLLHQQEILKQKRAIEQQRLDEEFARQLQCELEVESQYTSSVRPTQLNDRTSSPLGQPILYQSRSKPPSFYETPPQDRYVLSQPQSQSQSQSLRRESTDEELARHLQMQLEEDAEFESDSDHGEEPQYHRRQQSHKSHKSRNNSYYEQHHHHISDNAPGYHQHRQPSPLQRHFQHRQEDCDVKNCHAPPPQYQSYLEVDNHNTQHSSAQYDQRNANHSTATFTHNHNHQHDNQYNQQQFDGNSFHSDEQALIDEQIARELQEQLELETALEQSQSAKSHNVQYSSAANTSLLPPPPMRRREAALSDEELARRLQRQMDEDQHGVINDAQQIAPQYSEETRGIEIVEDAELLRIQEEFSRFEMDSVVSELTFDDEGSILSRSEGAPHYSPHPTRMTIQQQQHVQQSQFYASSSRRGSSAMETTYLDDEQTYLESRLLQSTPVRDGGGMHLEQPQHQQNQQWSVSPRVLSPQPPPSSKSTDVNKKERGVGGFSSSSSVLSSDNQSVMTKNAEDLYHAQKMRFAAPPTSVLQVRAPQMRSYVEDWRRNSSLGVGEGSGDGFDDRVEHYESRDRQDRPQERRDSRHHQTRIVRRESGVEQRRQMHRDHEQQYREEGRDKQTHRHAHASCVQDSIEQSRQSSGRRGQNAVARRDEPEVISAIEVTPHSETADTLQSETNQIMFDDIHHDQLPGALISEGGKLDGDQQDNKKEEKQNSSSNDDDEDEDDDLDSLAWSHLSDDESLSLSHFEARNDHIRSQGGDLATTRHSSHSQQVDVTESSHNGQKPVSGGSPHLTVLTTDSVNTISSGGGGGGGGGVGGGGSGSFNREIDMFIAAADSVASAQPSTTTSTSTSTSTNEISPLKRTISDKISFLASKFDSPVQKPVAPPVSVAHTKWVKTDEIIPSPARESEKAD